MSNRKLFVAVVLLAVSLIVAVKKLDNGAGAVAVQEKEDTGCDGRLETCHHSELLLQRGKAGQMLHRKWRAMMQGCAFRCGWLGG